MRNPFKRNKPPRWFFEAEANSNSNTIRVQVYRHGVPFTSCRMTATPECKDVEAEKVKFVNAIKLIYDEGRKDC